jgi:tRNA(adenine34) deaminase
MRYIFENDNSNKDEHKVKYNSNYIKWMKLILKRSEEIGKLELPISSIILDERGRCIGRGVNRRNFNKDPLGHAEIMALRQASLIKNDWRFNECIIITNLEPCTMCASALIQARMGKVVFGAYDKKRGGLGGSIDLSKHSSSHHKMEIEGGILEEECIQILQLWFKKLRTRK